MKLIEQLVLLSSNILDTKGEGKGLLIIRSLSLSLKTLLLG